MASLPPLEPPIAPLPPPAAADDLPPRRQVARHLRLVMSGLLRSVEERMQPFGLTALQWEPLLLIHARRIDTVAALARESRVNCGSMTRMLDRLETKELLRRRRSSTDRRVVHIELTPKGERIANEILPFALEALDLHLQGFTAEEVATLNGLLGRMLANGNRAHESDE